MACPGGGLAQLLLWTFSARLFGAPLPQATLTPPPQLVVLALGSLVSPHFLQEALQAHSCCPQPQFGMQCIQNGFYTSMESV